MEVSVIINGHRYSLDVHPKDSLLFVLREQIGLTGVKNGCSQGHCGACTVIMNGKAVKACLTKVKKFNNSNIVTIEGISQKFPDKELHPIQKAFIETTAVQCGFCTPGFIMELLVLYEKSPNASENEIRTSLEGHLCRCTGYKPILDASLLSQKLMKEWNRG